MTTILTPLPTTLVLDGGAHDDREAGVCFMEAVAWRAGEQHTDHPVCTSPVLGAFCRSLNDQWDNKQRQRLLPYLDRIIGTADGRDEERAWMATDWLVRTYAPAWLDLAGCTEAAAELRDLRRIVDRATAVEAQPAQQRARAAGYAAWAAAGYAARAAAGYATRAAAGYAAWAAAGYAAWAAAGYAARAAAGYAARAAAGYAARAAARDALAPTVEMLQASALDLLDAMIEVGR